MKKLAALFLAFILLMPSTPPLADDAYYLELGRAADEKQAEQQWQKLLSHYKQVLGKLEMHASRVAYDGSAEAVRLYAGPAENKTQASRVCRKLFTGDASCFVLEGSLPMSTPPQPMPWRSLPQSLPWQQHAPETLPWLLGEEPAKQTPMPKKLPRVDVAEAVRVPLSKPLPEVRLVAAPVYKSARQERAAPRRESMVPKSYWLQFATAGSERAAVEQWQRLKLSHYDLLSDIRGSINMHFIGNAEHVVRAGPIKAGLDAVNLCTRLKDRGVPCQVYSSHDFHWNS